MAMTKGSFLSNFKSGKVIMHHRACMSARVSAWHAPRLDAQDDDGREPLQGVVHGNVEVLQTASMPVSTQRTGTVHPVAGHIQAWEAQNSPCMQVAGTCLQGHECKADIRDIEQRDRRERPRPLHMHGREANDVQRLHQQAEHALDGQQPNAGRLY